MGHQVTARKKLFKKTQTGVTLLEALLVLVIASSLVYLALKQYEVFKTAGDVQALQANVDDLFQAMSQFYKANCYGSYDPNTQTITWGLMNPKAGSMVGMYGVYVLDIPSQLQPYMTTTLTPNPIVDTTSPSTTSGYVAQFNKYTYAVSICTTASDDSDPATGPYPSTGCATARQKGTVVIWRPQVSVALMRRAKAAQLYNATGATCGPMRSPLTGAPLGCGSTRGVGNATQFLAWERQANYASPQATSLAYRSANALVAQFTQMYRESPITYLVSTNHSPEIQYFNCGG